jgi:predicted ribosome-associated RNA-binding protein Tma20
VELIIVKHWDSCTEINLARHSHEIIVDTVCGASVLRGAHIYAPGILGMPCGKYFNVELN